MIHLILGGARSGKSSYAEAQAKACSPSPVYIATGQARDAEMQSRIDHHRAERGNEWHVIEQPTALSAAILQLDKRCIVVDCLTLWLSNCLESQCWDNEKRQFLEAAKHHNGDLFLVGNELGSGVVPMGKLTREFVDENGRLHQDLAAISCRVTTVIAGLPLHLKGGEPL